MQLNMVINLILNEVIYLIKKIYLKNFIEELYNIRLNYPKTEPMNFIAKILMNSLYGRFGMDDQFNDIIVIEKNDLNKFENKYINNITDILELDNKLLVKIKRDNLNNMLDNGSITHNINIVIASAITSYSRIHMSKFKNNNDYKLF